MKNKDVFLIKNLTALSLLLLSLHASSDDDKGLSSRWIKVLPESKSHQTYGTAQVKELPLSIRALVWNIKKAELPGWKKEFQEYARGRNLFLLQETYERDVFTATIEDLGQHWDMGISFLYRAQGDAATGTMIGSPAFPVEVTIKHSLDREPLLLTPKALTFAKYDLHDRDEDLLAISVHAINFETTGAFERQMDQIEVEVSKHKGPVLLAGDFNTWNSGRTQYLFKMVERLGLNEAPYIDGEYRMKFRSWPLDHVFSRGATVKSAKVIKEAFGSDHRPLLIDLEIN